MAERLTDWVRKPHSEPSPWPTLLLTLASGLGLGVLSLWFAAIDNRTAMFISYFTHPLILLLNLAPVLLLMALLFLVTRRSYVAFPVASALVLGFTFVNWYKLRFRDDPLLFEDILLIKEAGNMAGNYALTINKSMILALLLVVAGTAVLYFLAPWKPGNKIRLGGLAVAVLCAVPLGSAMKDNAVYTQKTRNFDLVSQWSATGTYLSKGFVYPFLHSVFSATDTPPEGYNADRAKQLLAGYENADIPDGQKVDVIGIMLEAYNDFTKFGAPDVDDRVYAYWHQLEKESISGNLLTNIFAGGTVDTERCYLTGYSDLGSFRSPTNSYPWYFKEQGYTVEGDHPCYQWFYNRLNVNANLGFDTYRFIENYYADLTGGRPGTDGEFFSAFLPHYQNDIAPYDEPYFNFSVTYQGHGPYDAQQLWWGDGWVADDGYTAEELTILNNYFGSIHNTNENLKVFVETLRESKRPVVLVLFGDHNPWMGDGNSIYHRLGINLDLSTEEGFRNYYSTRYLIWANQAAKDALGQDFTGSGPDIGPYFLMNEVFSACGWKGPAYLQAVAPIARQVPMVHTTDRYLEHGAITDTLTPEGEALVQDYKNLEYYFRKHFAYSSLTGKD